MDEDEEIKYNTDERGDDAFNIASS